MPQFTLFNSRVACFLLLLVNLAFLAWAVLIDRPPDAPLPLSTARLPQLMLASEARRAGTPPSAPAAAGATNNGAASSSGAVGGAGADSNASPAATQGATPGAGPAPANSTAPSNAGAALTPGTAVNPAGASGAAASGVAPPIASSAPSAAASPPSSVAAGASAAVVHCVTVGPFDDPARAAQGVAMLRQRGFTPRQRDGASEPRSGYWVYVGGLSSEAQQAEVVRKLDRNGIHDAHAMPDAQQGRRVSVGLFNERQGAERRARAVRGLGLTADIVERSPSAGGYWVDLDLASSTQTLPMEGLLSLEDSGAHLEIRECPGQAAAPAHPADASPRPARTGASRLSSPQLSPTTPASPAHGVRTAQSG